MKTDRQAVKFEKITWLTLAVLIASLIVWLQLTGSRLWQDGSSFPRDLMIFLGYGVISLCLSHFFANTPLKHPFPYRIAFLVAAVLGLILLLLESLDRTGAFTWGRVLLLVFGGFIGSFVASNQEMRWWENNAPPSPEVEKAVLEAHRDYLTPKTNRMPGKRLFDITFAILALLLSLPIWLLVIALIWWEDPGPILFVKNAVGRGGRNFKQLKFRSMVFQAEGDRGPIPITGYENDERVLLFGKFLRKTALDEVPQLINILAGDMSAVGPRPQRTVLVHGYLKEMPAYARRHQVRPGLAGLAQVVDTYDISPAKKLAWDLVYIKKSNLWLDLKLLIFAFYLVFALRWSREPHPEGRIRNLLGVKQPEEFDSQ